MKSMFACCLLLFLAAPVMAQDKYPPGIWEGYDGEWLHVSQQLVALAEATPPEKFRWRPAPGVRSTSEVYMHIVMANFYLLSVTGPKMPADLNEDAEKTVVSKEDVIRWLKRSLEAVKEAHQKETPQDLKRKVHIADRDAPVEGLYLRILVHANEHMGQLVAYARMTGVRPPWSNGNAAFRSLGPKKRARRTASRPEEVDPWRLAAGEFSACQSPKRRWRT